MGNPRRTRPTAAARGSTLGRVLPFPITSGQSLRSFRSAHVTLTETRHPCGMTLPRHAHEHACLNFVLSGVYDERIEGVAPEHEPLGLVFKPALAEHANCFAHGGARCLLVELTSAEFGPLGVDLSSPAESRDPRAATLALALWNELAGTPDSLAVEALTLELYAQVLGSRETRVLEQRSPRLAAAAARLHEDPSTPWTLSRLAAEVGLHPSHLARAFHARHGVTIGEYLRHLRVARAARRLAQSEEPIASVARTLGFADQSHLTRAFRARLGLTPGAFRRRLRGG
jgi:AraC family transcriptional regulator